VKRTLDLGCGDKPRNPYNADLILGVDINGKQDGFIDKVDLTINPLPYVDEMFDYVSAYDFLEHIPRTIYIDGKLKYPFVDLMSEVWRVLKPGGLFYSSTPCAYYPAAFQDPTHVNYVTPETFGEYFDDKKTWAKQYGFKGQFKIMLLEIKEPHLIAVLKKT